MEVKVSTRSLSEGQVWAWGELGGAVKGAVAHSGSRRGSRNASRCRRERVMAGELGFAFRTMVGAFLSLGFATEEVEECREQTSRGKSDLIWVSVRSEARSWRVARLTPPRLRARDQAGVCELGGGWKVEWS
jgi:hypothetical protein